MKFFSIFNVVALALTTTFAVTLLVVVLMYAVNLEYSPRMRREFDGLLKVTAIFAVQSVAGGLAVLGHRRGWSLRWGVQAVFVATLLLGAQLVRSVINV